MSRFKSELTWEDIVNKAEEMYNAYDNTQNALRPAIGLGLGTTLSAITGNPWIARAAVAANVGMDALGAMYDAWKRKQGK